MVLGKHALRNAAIPILTLLGLQAGQLMGGAVLTETVFAWPGLGRLMVKAIFARDYVLLQGAVLVFALAFVLINLLVDLAYGAARSARVAAGLADGLLRGGSARGPGGGRRRDGAAERLGPFRRNRLAVVGLVLVALLLVAAAGAPWLAPYDPAKQSLIEKRAQPGGKFLLGADEFGRDILSRVIYGAAWRCWWAALGGHRAARLGLMLGCLAGFAGGWVDALMMRAIEVLLAFPYLLLAIAMVSALGPGVVNTTIAVGIWGAPAVTRIVRGAVLAARETEYVGAARALGRPRAAGAARATCCRNILPDRDRVLDALHGQRHPASRPRCRSWASACSRPTPSWGLMVSTGRDVLLVAPHVATVPGLAIMVAVLGFNLAGRRAARRARPAPAGPDLPCASRGGPPSSPGPPRHRPRHLRRAGPRGRARCGRATCSRPELEEHARRRWRPRGRAACRDRRRGRARPGRGRGLRGARGGARPGASTCSSTPPAAWPGRSCGPSRRCPTPTGA